MTAMTFDKQIKALAKISQAIVSDAYLEDILRLVVTASAELMDSKICSLMLLNEEKELIIRATQSVSEEYNKKPPLKIGEGIAGKVVQTGKPICVHDVTTEKEYKNHSIAKKEGLFSLLCLPLAVKGRVIGVLNCYTGSPHDFTTPEIDILTAIANQSAIAIENAELMVKSKIIHEELEARKRIERAKGILCKREGLTEEEAYLKLRRCSMDRRKTMREIAEAIILADDLTKR